MTGVTEGQIHIIAEYLRENVNPYFAYLFGSSVQNRLTKESDIDIAFLSDNEVTAYDSFLMAQELADRLGREVDLVNLAKASTVFKAQVVGTRKVIIDRDPNQRMIFEMRSFKEYAKLNEERQCILDKIREKGTIFYE